MIGKKGKDIVAIPLPQIDIPQFRYGDKQRRRRPGRRRAGHRSAAGRGAAGQGRPATGRAATSSKSITLEELAEILGEELELPRIEPKGTEKIVAAKDKYTGIRTTGPESLRHFRRTYQPGAAPADRLGHVRPEDPSSSRSARTSGTAAGKRAAAAVQRRHHLHDGRLRLDDRRAEGDRPHRGFWIDTWLRRQYQGIETRYIIHDAVAKEVDETRSTTRARAAAPGSARPTSCARR